MINYGAPSTRKMRYCNKAKPTSGSVLDGLRVSGLRSITPPGDQASLFLCSASMQGLCSDDLSWYLENVDSDREFLNMARSGWFANASAHLAASTGDALYALGSGLLRLLPPGVARWLEGLRDALRPLNFEVRFSEEECDPAIKSQDL